MDHKAYIRRETGVSIVINAVLSALFFWIVFRGVDPVPTWGVGNWVFDFVPQSFMIALMSTLVPGALTGKAIRTGRITAHGAPGKLPGNLFARAGLLAVMSAVIGTGLIALAVAAIGVLMVPAGVALTLKVVYGAVLALVVTPPGLRRALASK